MVSAGRSMFLLVVIIPAGCFVPAGSYGLCWWLRVPAGRHTSAGGFISTGGCVFLLFSWFLLIVDSFCWLDTFMLLALFMLSKHLFKLLNCWSVSTGRFLLVVTQFLLLVSNHAGIIMYLLMNICADHMSVLLLDLFLLVLREDSADCL
nr:hypothetical protein [Tanacetum cinerariifolium]